MIKSRLSLFAAVPLAVPVAGEMRPIETGPQQIPKLLTGGITANKVLALVGGIGGNIQAYFGLIPDCGNHATRLLSAVLAGSVVRP